MSSQRMASEDNYIVLGDAIMGGDTYRVQSLLGEGSFGQVVKCVRESDNTTVAVKVLKKRGYYHEQAENEVEALLKLKDLDVDECNLVQFYSDFMHKGFYCMVFEYLEQSLADFMMARDFHPLPLSSIRVIAQQLGTALQTLRSVGLTHTDIKLDNVMLVNHGEQPFRVKLIDFGLAKNTVDLPKGATIQPLCYRSPEVFLGLYLTEAVDMWSLGCLCARLYLGVQLFHGKNDYEMVRSIVTSQGLPPVRMLRAGLRSHLFFNKRYDNSWELKTPREYHREMGHLMMGKTTALVPKPLEDIFNVSSVEGTERSELVLFVDMLKKMFHINPTLRIKPRQLLRHKFIIGPSPFNAGSPPSAALHRESCVQAATTAYKTTNSESKTLSPIIISSKNHTETQTLTPEKKRQCEDDEINGNQHVTYLHQQYATEESQKQQLHKPIPLKRKLVDAEYEGHKKRKTEHLSILPQHTLKYNFGCHQAKYVVNWWAYEKSQRPLKPKPLKQKLVDAEGDHLIVTAPTSSSHSSCKSLADYVNGTKDSRRKKCRKRLYRKKT